MAAPLSLPSVRPTGLSVHSGCGADIAAFHAYGKERNVQCTMRQDESPYARCHNWVSSTGFPLS